MVGPSGKFPARRVNRFSWMRSPLANYLISQEIVLSFANATPDCSPRGPYSGNCTAPVASSGKSGFQATSQRKPSRSRKYPAYPPQGAFWAGFMTSAAADRASAKTASTSSFDRALWAIENPPNPAPSSGIPASFASSDRGNSDSAIEPHWKNDAPSAPLTDRRQPRRSRNAVLFAKSRTPSVRSVILCSMLKLRDLAGYLAVRERGCYRRPLAELCFPSVQPCQGRASLARRLRRASPLDRAHRLGRFLCKRSAAGGSTRVPHAWAVMAGLVPAIHAVVAGADAGRLGHHHDQQAQRHSLHRRHLRYRPSRLRTSRRLGEGVHEALRSEAPRVHGVLRDHYGGDPARVEHEALAARLEGTADCELQSRLARLV